MHPSITLPNDTDLERQIIAAYFFGFGDDYNALSPELFYSGRNQSILETIRDMQAGAVEVNLATVTAFIRLKDDLDYVGGAYGLTKLIYEPVPTCSDWACNKIKQLYESRKKIIAAWRTIKLEQTGAVWSKLE